MTEAATESPPETPTTGRLVIRIDLTPAEPPPPAPPRSSKGAVLLIVGVVAVLLSWLGFSVFKSDPAQAPAAVAVATPDSAAATSSAASKPAAETTAATSTEAPPAFAPAPDAPTASVNEVLPTASPSSLATIRGTIRVSVRVTLDKRGSVTNVTSVEPGPSRYFARLAADAAKQWTFTPVTSEAQRQVLLQFSFTRSGATAIFDPPLR